MRQYRKQRQPHSLTAPILIINNQKCMKQKILMGQSGAHCRTSVTYWSIKLPCSFPHSPYLSAFPASPQVRAPAFFLIKIMPAYFSFFLPHSLTQCAVDKRCLPERALPYLQICRFSPAYLNEKRILSVTFSDTFFFGAVLLISNIISFVNV